MKNRAKTVENIVHRVLSKNNGKYTHILILDEAVSGSSANMVRKAVVRAVKRLRKDKGWQRTYWKHLPVHVLALTAHNGEKLERSIRRMNEFRFFHMHGEIPTMDRTDISPVRYPDTRRTVVSSKGVHAVKEEIERGARERLRELGLRLEK